MDAHPLRLAVSGTYSSGKTTTTEALSIAAGIPRTDALTAREIVVDLIPGKSFQQLNASELLMLGLRRLEERIHTEAAQPGSFVSDGSVLHEWIYGEVRMRIGINPGAPLLQRAVKRVVGIPSKPFMQRYMDAYGVVVKARTKRLYDHFVHLPIEFGMQSDGHRPVSEKYRVLSDQLLIETLEELEMPYHVVGGTVPERVARILDLFGLPAAVPVDEAVGMAEERIRRSREMVAERVIASHQDVSMARKVRYAMRY
jgi:hypothetical protein